MLVLHYTTDSNKNLHEGYWAGSGAASVKEFDTFFHCFITVAMI